MSAIERGVRAGYRHVPKASRPAPSIDVGDAVLKWYDIAPADAPVPPDVRDAGARDALRAAAGRASSSSPTSSAS